MLRKLTTYVLIIQLIAPGRQQAWRMPDEGRVRSWGSDQSAGIYHAHKGLIAVTAGCRPPALAEATKCGRAHCAGWELASDSQLNGTCRTAFGTSGATHRPLSDRCWLGGASASQVQSACSRNIGFVASVSLLPFAASLSGQLDEDAGHGARLTRNMPS